MPQEFQVLRCFSCATFQVQHVTKSSKWKCKMCNAGQSVKKVYGRGSGIDCRKHVQKLNMLRGEIEMTTYNGSEVDEGTGTEAVDDTQIFTSNTSKWTGYMDGPFMHSEEGYHDQDDKVFTTERQEFEKNKVKLKRSRQTSREYGSFADVDLENHECHSTSKRKSRLFEDRIKLQADDILSNDPDVKPPTTVNNLESSNLLNDNTSPVTHQIQHSKWSQYLRKDNAHDSNPSMKCSSLHCLDDQVDRRSLNQNSKDNFDFIENSTGFMKCSSLHCLDDQVDRRSLNQNSKDNFDFIENSTGFNRNCHSKYSNNTRICEASELASLEDDACLSLVTIDRVAGAPFASSVDAACMPNKTSIFNIPVDLDLLLNDEN